LDERAGRYWKDALPGRTLAHIVPGDIARYMAQRSQEVALATINRALRENEVEAGSALEGSSEIGSR